MWPYTQVQLASSRDSPLLFFPNLKKINCKQILTLLIFILYNNLDVILITPKLQSLLPLFKSQRSYWFTPIPKLVTIPPKQLSPNIQTLPCVAIRFPHFISAENSKLLVDSLRAELL